MISERKLQDIRKRPLPRTAAAALRRMKELLSVEGAWTQNCMGRPRDAITPRSGNNISKGDSLTNEAFLRLISKCGSFCMIGAQIAIGVDPQGPASVALAKTAPKHAHLPMYTHHSPSYRDAVAVVTSGNDCSHNTQFTILLWLDRAINEASGDKRRPAAFRGLP
jgi:hypothetical protein